MTRKRASDWGALAGLWQSEQAFDAKALAQAVRRKTRRMALVFALEVLLAMAGAALGIYVLGQARELFEAAVGAFAVVFSGFSLFLSWEVRRGAWRAASESVADQLRLTLKRARVGIRYANLNIGSAIPASLFVAIVAYHRADAIFAGDARGAFLLGMIGAVTVFMVGIVIWAFRFRRKKRAEAARLEELLDELSARGAKD